MKTAEEIKQGLDNIAAAKSITAVGGEEAAVKYTLPKAVKLPISEIALKHLTETRGIAASTMEAYQLGVTEKTGAIIIPIIDENGKTVRNNFRHQTGGMLKIGGDETKEHPEANGRPILLGTHLADPDAGDLVIAFGTYDALALHSAGIANACSVPGGDNNTKWIKLQYEWLKKFDRITLCFDSIVELETEDREKKQQWQHNIVARLGAWRCSIVEETGSKDMNDLLLKSGRETVQAAVKNAVPFQQSGLVKLAENKTELDFETSIPTNWATLDKIIGGLMPKRYTILAGDPSAGKSSIAINVAKAVVDAGKSVFYWPGEQDLDEIQYWADIMFAGDAGTEWRTSKRTGAEYSVVLPEAKTGARKHYGERLWAFDRNSFEESKNGLMCGVNEFFQMCEIAIRREGCQVVVLDNLTALATNEEILTGTDYFRTQAQIVTRCKNMAKSYGVHFIVCVHTRKSPGGKDAPMVADRDNIEGLKRLVNLADLVLHVRRVHADKQVGEYTGVDTIIEVQKNRVTGLEGDQILFKFNRKTKTLGELGGTVEVAAKAHENFGKDAVVLGIIDSNKDLDKIPF